MYSTQTSFLVINVCNQGKNLCSPCIINNAVYSTRSRVHVIDIYCELKINVIQDAKQHKLKVIQKLYTITSRKLSANLYDIYHCSMYSEKLLMMDRGTVRNMQSFIPKINLRNQCIQLVFVLILLASCQQTCMTYTIAVCTVKNS